MERRETATNDSVAVVVYRLTLPDSLKTGGKRLTNNHPLSPPPSPPSHGPNFQQSPQPVRNKVYLVPQEGLQTLPARAEARRPWGVRSLQPVLAATVQQRRSGHSQSGRRTQRGKYAGRRGSPQGVISPECSRSPCLLDLKYNRYHRQKTKTSCHPPRPSLAKYPPTSSLYSFLTLISLCFVFTVQNRKDSWQRHVRHRQGGRSHQDRNLLCLQGDQQEAHGGQRTHGTFISSAYLPLCRPPIPLPPGQKRDCRPQEDIQVSS